MRLMEVSPGGTRPVDHEYVPLPLNLMCFFWIKNVPKPQGFKHISWPLSTFLMGFFVCSLCAHFQSQSQFDQSVWSGTSPGFPPLPFNGQLPPQLISNQAHCPYVNFSYWIQCFHFRQCSVASSQVIDIISKFADPLNIVFKSITSHQQN